MMYNITYIKEDGTKKSIKVKEGTTILEGAIKAGVYIDAPCGTGKCGKCKVLVEKGLENIDKDSIVEDEYALACVAKVYGDISINVPNFQGVVCKDITNEVGELQTRRVCSITEQCKGELQNLEGFHPMSLNPDIGINKITTTVLESSNYNLTLDAINKLNSMKLSDEVTLILKGDNVVNVEKDFSGIYGLSIDIGTTSVVVYLVDISKGIVLDNISFLNPQRQFGADVVSRIAYNNGILLQKTLITELNDSISKLCSNNNIKMDNIYEVSVVGNTAMIHFFYGIVPKNLATHPYVPTFKNSPYLPAKELGLNLRNAYIYTLPIIGGYVGADTVGAILSSEMHKKDDISLLIDIGTNGEIVLGNKEKLLTCSCAAGPAFEGVSIEHGTNAREGAVCRVKIDENNIYYETIGNKTPPIGICGSGIIDIVAEFLKSGLINKTGRFTGEHKNLKENKFIIEDSIYFTQGDIREVQLAKGAIYAGIKILCYEYGISMEDISNVYVTGAFGCHIDVENAKIIGLLPDLDNILSIDNAAGRGTIMALLSKKIRNEADKLAKNTKYIELSSHDNFESEFISALGF
ncbi:ASKHA domain-containing protein [Methanococcus aeolicus]|nr:ASKHA domain-containing protein [Methanococcus aeolicus]